MPIDRFYSQLGEIGLPPYQFARTIGPYPWELSPPDGEWHYPPDFGVRTNSLDISYFDKVKNRSIRYKPAEHAECNGEIMPVMAPSLYSPFDYDASVYRGRFLGELFKWNYLDGDGALSLVGSRRPGPHLEYGDTVFEQINADRPGVLFDLDDPWVYVNGEGDTLATVVRASNILLRRPIPDSGLYGLSNQFISSVGTDICTRSAWPRPTGDPTAGFTPVPNFRYGNIRNFGCTVEAMRNDGDNVTVRGTWTYSGTSIGSTGGPPLTFSRTGVFECPLVWHQQDWPLFPREDVCKQHFRSTCFDISHSPALVSDRKRVRTYALIDLENVGTNNLENISGLSGAGDFIATLREGYIAFKNLNPVAALRALSGAYLGYKYAVASTGRDIQSIRKLGPGVLKRIQRPEMSIDIRRSSDSVSLRHPYFSFYDVRLSAEYILKRNTDLESQIIIALDSLGLLPSPGNLWDLVPLSFCVDWFYNLGNVFEAMRYERDTWHYTLHRRIESQKFQFTCTQEFVEFVFGKGWIPTGQMGGKLYKRTIHHKWGVIDPFLVSEGSGYGSQQIVDSVALILQRAI